MPTDRGSGPTPRLGATLDFMRRLWAIEHALQAASKRMSATLAVTGPQRVALRVVARSPGMSAKQLAHTLHLHPSTLTGILSRLEDRGLIRRRVDTEDGRSVHLFVTAAGRTLTRSPAGTVEASVQRALKRIDPGDLEATCRVMAILTDALQQPRKHEITKP